MFEAIRKKILPKKVLVVGDLMIDHYTFGKVKRISPEAPVPILHVEKEKELPGGAGNVMSNLASLGMEAIALGRIGKDRAGATCISLLREMGIKTEGIFQDPTFTTPVKKRLIADGQQLLRVDYEQKQPLGSEWKEKMIAFFAELLPHIDAIAISDYDKGSCCPSLLAIIIEKAKEANIPVIADPKGIHFARYKGATVLKPNLSEAFRAAKLPEEAGLEEVAGVLLKETECSYLMVTRGAEGISLFSRRGRQDFPAIVQEVKDVTGAGDTVCAITLVALANKIALDEAMPLANHAAAYVVQHVGCVPVDLNW